GYHSSFNFHWTISCRTSSKISRRSFADKQGPPKQGVMRQFRPIIPILKEVLNPWDRGPVGTHRRGAENAKVAQRILRLRKSPGNSGANLDRIVSLSSS